MWLVEHLKTDFPERIIPPLPDKNRLEYLGRFTPDFIKRRQLGLKRFLLRIDGHEVVRECEVFQSFLKMPIVGMTSENNVKRCDSEASLIGSGSPAMSKSATYLKPVVDSLTDVAASLFSRSPKNIPQEFVQLRKDVKMVRNHLSHLEKLFSNRVMGHQPAIIEGMKEIASNFDELSSSIDLSLNAGDYPNSDGITPPFVKSMLSRVSATMTQCAHLLDKSIDDQEVNLLAVLLEYTQYCDAALEIIDARDRRQVEVEELTNLIGEYTREISELEGSANDTDHTDSTENTADSTSPAVSASTSSANKGLFEYLSSKWDSWKGVDPITARQNRLQKCLSRLQHARTALSTSAILSKNADSALSQEIRTFLELMKGELGREFESHGKSQVRYHETNLVYWRDFLAWLDNPPKHL